MAAWSADDTPHWSAVCVGVEAGAELVVETVLNVVVSAGYVVGLTMPTWGGAGDV